MSGDRRIAIMQVTAHFIIDACKNGPPRYARVTANALPDDARYVGMGYDADRGYLYLVIGSDTFAEVPPGERPPLLDPTTFEVVYAEVS